MSKIININAYRHKKQHSGQMDYAATFDVQDKFEVAAVIVVELFLQSEACIRDSGFDPAEFMLIKDSAYRCLDSNLNEFFEGGEEALSLAYEAEIGDVRYATVASASINGDEVWFDTAFVKWDGKEWLEYANGSWHQGPGADFV